MPDLTVSEKGDFLHHVREGMRPGAAAEAMGYTRHDVYEWLEDEAFKTEVEEAEREATEHVEEALYQAAVSGNVTACKMWLDLRKPKAVGMVVAAASDEPSFDAELAALNSLAAGED